MTTSSAFDSLAVGVLARDAGDLLPGMLRSVPAGAEIVVADGGSRDDTVALARSAGATVIPQDLDEIRCHGGNFDLARNQVADVTSRPWLLFLDADERLSPELCLELEEVLGTPQAEVAFDIPRVNLYWGRPVRALGDDFQRRLVRRGCGRFSGDELHRRMEVDGPVGQLSNPIIHLNVRSWRDVAGRFRGRIEIEAATHRERPSALDLFAGPWSLFRYYYLTNQARRDGARGLAVCLFYAANHGAVLWRRRQADRA